MRRKRVIIMGAAGRDFHTFNVYFRSNDLYEVVAFTATQIPNIEGRKYPALLAGSLYPNGIPIYSEERLTELILKEDIDEVYFSYSDVSHEYVMHKASEVMAAGANFVLLGAKATMLEALVPVVAICAVRTGSGKSQTTRRVTQILRKMGKRFVVVRHPMPYGDLAQQRVERFATYEDLDRYNCTIEEREEFEPHLAMGNIVYAGVEYGEILEQAQQEAEVIVWDGGNNDIPFYKPTLHIVVTDPLRPGHELRYYPGETNLRMADVVVINKETTANFADIEQVRRNIRAVNPKAIIVDATSPIFIEDGELIQGKRVLIIEDGPTVTHGEMSYGAGFVAAERFGAAEIVDPRPYAAGSIRRTFEKYPHLAKVLPAMGYGRPQMHELEMTINNTPCDAVIIGTPMDLRRLIQINKPATRVRYELHEIGSPNLEEVIQKILGPGVK